MRPIVFLLLAAFGQAPAPGAYEAPNPAYAAPASYYNAAAGTGTTLRTNLHTIITSGFVGISYGDARYILDDLDEDPNNTANVLLVYNRASVNGAWDFGVTWNREHLWPQSKLGVSVDNSYIGPGSDLFELKPCDPDINSSRSNDAYGLVGSSGSYQNGASYFFPGDADKGDAARAIFYMATRYYTGGAPSSNNLNIVNGTSIATYQMGDLQSLLKWHYTDAIDNFERRRNDMIYDNYQHNRNPFVDHPEYVWAIFGKDAAGNQLNNSSQLSVGTPDANGGSTADVGLGRIMLNGSFGTSNVTFNKTGTTPTTFDVATAGNATIAPGGANNLIAGVGQDIDYNAQSRTITVGLDASTATTGLKTGTITIDNTDLTSAAAGQGSADGNDTIGVSGAVLAKRVVTGGPTSVDFGVAIVGATIASPVSLSTAGDDNSFTRINVAGSSAVDSNGMQLNGATALFDSATSTSTRTFGGTLNSAGSISGTLSLDVTTAENGGSGLSGEGAYSPLTIGYSGSVLDHANASFSSESDTDTLTIDFGAFNLGSGSPQQSFSLHNLLATVGFTAPLDLLTIVPAGDSAVLTTSLTLASQIDNLTASSSLSFLAEFSTASPGDFSATYTLDFSDDTAILGALGGQILTLNLHGIVNAAAVAGDFDADGDVDGADFVAWQTNFPLASGATLAMGDADADGDVDGADFVIWQSHFPSGPAAGFVPEPASGWLAAAASAILIGLAGHRSKRRK